MPQHGNGLLVCRNIARRRKRFARFLAALGGLKKHKRPADLIQPDHFRDALSQLNRATQKLILPRRFV